MPSDPLPPLLPSRDDAATAAGQPQLTPPAGDAASGVAGIGSDARLRLLIEQSPTSIHVFDISGRTVLVNPAFERMWGLTLADLDGYVIWDDPQLQGTGMRSYLERARRGEVVHVPPYHHDAAISVGQGAARVIEATAYPVKDETGTVREVVVLTTDVSDRVRAEELARAGERRMREALDLAPQPLVEVDPDGTIIYANAAAEARAAASGDTLVGRRYDSAEWRPTTLDGGRLDQAEMPVARALRGESVRGFVMAVPGPGGARRIMELHAAPRRDAQGAVTGVLVAWEDVTQRHLATAERERLLEAERDARAEADRKRRQADFLAEASRLLAASLDYERTLQSLAASAVPMLGDWCAVDMLRAPRTATPPDEPVLDWPPEVRRLAVAHQDAAKVAWARELQQRAPQDWDGPIGLPKVLREGTSEFYPAIDDALLAAVARTPEQLTLMREFGYSAYICVPLVARGQLLGALTLCHTDSGRHYDADDLALAEDLAHRAAVAVDNARLYRDALEANQAKADFLAVMSHELRTPLNAILGYAGLLDGEVAGALNPGQRDFVKRGGDAARRLLTLVDDLLTFAKLEAGRMTMQMAFVPVQPLVGEVASLVAPQAAGKGIALEVVPMAGTLAVLADRERVTQVLLNLVGNAVKFTPAGGRVALQVGEPQPGLVHVAVHDTGPGIPPEERQRVFEPFVQLDAGRTRTTGGTGLGLAISRDLARAMDGDVLVESEPGAGSVFTLVLRRADGAPDA